MPGQAASGQWQDHGRLVAGRYRLVDRIGRGGMGTVWRAQDELLDRQVALKQLHVSPYLDDDELATLYERTRREARSAARITHPNVVVVHDVVDDHGLPCIVMEYVPSKTLGDVLRHGTITPEEAARIGRGMIAALRAAHAAGVLHRDVKPGNVLLGDDGRVVLTDFGIAQSTGTSTLTKTGEMVGSIDYIAPERVKGAKPGPASDLWALGATLYQALEGRPPFRKDTAVETAYAIAMDPLEPPRNAGELTRLIETLLAKDPAVRPPADLAEQILREPAAEADTAHMSAHTSAASVPEPRPAAPAAARWDDLPDRGTMTATAATAATTPAAPAAPAAPAVPAQATGPAADAATNAPGDQSRWRPWRFRMSNDVWGTPTVAGELLYVTSFEVHALDVATGRRQFKTRDVAWAMAVTDGRIHASDGPTLYALDAADGAERWRLATDGWVYSLRADRGTVVTGTRGGGVQAWEAANGELLWEMGGAQTDFETPDCGPLVHDGVVYVWADARLRALEARTGAERWSYPVGDTASCGGVPVRLLAGPDGVVYVAAGTRVLAIDVARGDVRWRFEAPAVFLSPPAFAPGPAVTGGGVYIADYLGTVYALDAATGRDRWRIATEARQSTEPVLVTAGSVHLGSGGALYTLDAVTGTPKWRFAAGGDVVGSPVIADGRIHFGSADHCLYTVDAAGGQLRWKLATGGEITGSPVAAGGVVYACSKDRCVYALDAAKGTGMTSRR
ncbi:serine/threonine-protein kinase [Streptosporangium nondiastaticum]|uniref:serine/threonine-protein kinase n=1 Tax=Streptosporangium nondiastaticum TaxID=35764 RepID=UPI001CB89340|nr:serine/threonine-protein kinase [Streptosporangium nondiastaticum]